jgi:superfamily II DNA or RNA helicase
MYRPCTVWCSPIQSLSAYVSSASMPFVIRSPEQDRPESPEALFRSLRPKDRAVRDLLLRQGDALRGYARLPRSETDVASELPTGGGKTLVGLLIAEWCRRALGHRVAYLCPTVQLARQVALKADGYGLDVVTLVRRQAEWDPPDFMRFQRAQAVAIAGYHQIFNSNPRLDSAQTLVLDDAHAAEDAVASS